MLARSGFLSPAEDKKTVSTWNYGCAGRASSLEKLAQAFAQVVAPAKEPAPIEDGSKAMGCCISAGIPL